MWERSGLILPGTPDHHRQRQRRQRQQLLRQQCLIDALAHDADRLLERITALLDQQSGDAQGTGYRLLPDPDDPDRGDLARQIAARKTARRPAALPPEDDGDAMLYVSDGPPS